MSEHRTVIVLNQTLTAAAPGFTVSLQQQGVPSTATHMIVRQLIYSNVSAGTDNGTFLLSMNNRNIAAVYVGIQSETICPSTTVTMPYFQPNVTFRLTAANSAFAGPTGQLTLVLEFY